MIQVELPPHLKTLARVHGSLHLNVAGEVSVSSVLDRLEAEYPMLRGAIRDQVTGQRRPFLRFFACQEDISSQSLDAPLPPAIVDGIEPLLIVGAIAGG